MVVARSEGTVTETTFRGYIMTTAGIIAAFRKLVVQCQAATSFLLRNSAMQLRRSQNRLVSSTGSLLDVFHSFMHPKGI